MNELAYRNSQFAERLESLHRDTPVDAIAAVPYGWIAREIEPNLYRMGDQAAVIPSLAGEGMAIAVVSARMAVDSYFEDRDAIDFQKCFAARAKRSVNTAKLIWNFAETERGATVISSISDKLPGLARLAMRLSRI